MANNIAVKISADVVDLVAKRAVMSAELKAATRDLNDFAKEAKAAGSSDALRTQMLESANAVAGFKAQISAVDRDMKNLRQEQAASIGITGQQRVGFQQLAYNINDVSTMYAMGSKASQIFASQSGQLIQTIGLLAGEGTKLATFLTSGWGIGVTVAASALVPLIGKLLETDDAAKDAKLSSEELIRSFDFRKVATTELIAALDELNKRQREQNDISRQSAIVAYDDARANLAVAMATRERLKAELERKIQTAKDVASLGEDPSGAVMLADKFRKGKLAEQEQAISKLIARQNELWKGAAGELVSNPAKAVYDRQLKALNDEYDAKKKITAEDREQYRLRLAKIEADYKATQKSTSSSGKSGLSGREIDSGEARSIAESAGFRVTSGDRTRAEQQRLYDTVRTPENPVAKPGTSAHERGNALDIAFGSGVTPQSIRKAFDDEGVRLTKLLKETGHYHIEWSTAGNDKAASAARREAKAAADEAERARKEKARQDQQLAMGAASTDLSVRQIDIADKRQAVQADYGSGAIDADQKRDLMKRLAEEEATAEFAAQEAKKQAYAGDVVAVQQAADQQRLIRADLTAQLNEIERQHTADLQRENEIRERNAREAARRQADEWRSVNQQILSAESQLVDGVLSGRQGMGQVLLSIGARLVQSEIANSIRYLTEKRLLAAEGVAIDQASSQRSIILTLLGEGRKTAATAAGTQARTAVNAAGAAQTAGIEMASSAPHVAAEAVKTTATAVGSQARVAATAVGAAESSAITGAHNLKEIASHAATAAAGAYHAMAAIPVVGPILGAAAAAATFTAVMAFGALASFDKGTNELPGDMVAQIHAGERIVPAADNREMMAIMRQGAGGGGASSRRGGDVHLHYNPKVNAGAPFAQQLAAHKNALLDMMRAAVRNGALSPA